MVITKKLTDLKYLHWDKTRESSGTAGSYLKSFSCSNAREVMDELSISKQSVYNLNKKKDIVVIKNNNYLKNNVTKIK